MWLSFPIGRGLLCYVPVVDGRKDLERKRDVVVVVSPLEEETIQEEEEEEKEEEEEERRGMMPETQNVSRESVREMG